jgi:metallophosphoesterase (TIGR00282 family)
LKDIKLLALGDVVRTVSCEYISRNLWKFRRENGIDIVVANGENSSENGGIDKYSADTLLSYGVDVITTGNHVFKNYDAKKLLDENKYVIRPANYPEALPGYGYTFFEAAGKKFLVINVMGIVQMEPLSDPFSAVEKILERNKGKYDVSVLDIHAEATSEKRAMGLFFDGKIDIIFGTHTHVQTADEQILPRGTGYITDLGMCGPDNSVLGIDAKCIVEKLRMHTPVKFTVSGTKVTAHGAVFTLDGATGKVKKAERVAF